MVPGSTTLARPTSSSSSSARARGPPTSSAAAVTAPATTSASPRSPPAAASTADSRRVSTVALAAPSTASRSGAGAASRRRASNLPPPPAAVLQAPPPPAPADDPVLSDDERALCARLDLSPRELVELKEVFRLVDKDGGGTISKDELEVLMRTLGLRASKVEVQSMVDEIVAPGKDEIDLEAFVTAMSRKVTTSRPHAELLTAFRIFDEGGPLAPTGRVRTADLFAILEAMGAVDRRLKHEDTEDLVSSLAPNALENGFFDYENYLSMLFSS
ncbi:Calmodulin-3 [Allomyces javanicus]|nr:Calmodulin-3 [Allomyces javanicus]